MAAATAAMLLVAAAMLPAQLSAQGYGGVPQQTGVRRTTTTFAPDVIPSDQQALNFHQQNPNPIDEKPTQGFPTNQGPSQGFPTNQGPSQGFPTNQGPAQGYPSNQGPIKDNSLDNNQGPSDGTYWWMNKENPFKDTGVPQGVPQGGHLPGVPQGGPQGVPQGQGCGPSECVKPPSYPVPQGVPQGGHQSGVPQGINPDNPFLSPGGSKPGPGYVPTSGHPVGGQGSPLTVTCSGSGYLCVSKASCSNGVVVDNGSGIQPSRPGVQQCNAASEACCRLPSGSQFPPSPTGGHFPPPPTGGQFPPPPTGDQFPPRPTGGNYPSHQGQGTAPGTNGIPIGGSIYDGQPQAQRPRPTPNPVVHPYTGPLNTTPYPGCAAALKCVELIFCTAEGVMVDTPVALTREQEENRVPLMECSNPDTGILGKCCRDPNYKDPWPAGMMMHGGGHGHFNDGQYHPDPTAAYTQQHHDAPSGQFPNQQGPTPHHQQPKPFPQQPPPQQNFPQQQQNFPQQQPGFPKPQPVAPQQPHPQQQQNFPQQQPSFPKPQPVAPQQPYPQQNIPQQQQNFPQQQPSFPKPQPVAPQQPYPQQNFPQQQQNFPQQQPSFPKLQPVAPQQPYPQQQQNFPQQQPSFPKPQPVVPQQPYPQQQPNFPKPQPVAPQQPYPQQQPSFPKPQPVAPLTSYPQQPTPGAVNFPQNTPQATGYPKSPDTSIPVQVAPLPGAKCGVRRPVDHSQLPQDEAGFGEFPWHVMVLSSTTRQPLCSGALVSDHAIVTPAHCIKGMDSTDILVECGVGSLGTNSGPHPSQSSPVAAIARHPNYDEGSQANDLAVVVLSGPVNLAQHVDTVCLPERGTTHAQQGCLATGYGKQAIQANTVGAPLHTVGVSLIANTECEHTLKQTHLGNYFVLNPSFQCAVPTVPANDLCKVDAGGPVVCDIGDGQYQLAGLYSWDTGCSQPSNPTVLAAADSDWIRSVLSRPVEDILRDELNEVEKKKQSHEVVDQESKPGFSQGYGRK